MRGPELNEEMSKKINNERGEDMKPTNQQADTLDAPHEPPPVAPPVVQVPNGPLPVTEPIMQFFGDEHVAPSLVDANKPFADLARLIVSTFPRNAERTVALRKLLESRDAALRAMVAK